MSKWRSVPKIRGAWPQLLVGTLLLAACALAYGRTLAPGVTWANGGYDSGELIAAVVTGGVPHPSGYPTYLLLAGLLQLLPLPDPALKVNLLSALAAALTALVLYATLLDWLGPRPPALAAAALAALSYALAPLVWSQAVIAEVYSLSMLFGALLLRAALAQARAAGPGRRAWGWSLLAGVALGAHLTLLPLVLGWLAVATLGGRRLPPPGAARWRSALRHLALAGAGALVYLALPLRAAAGPPISWGGADQWAGFWWLVTGRLYAGMLFGGPPAEWPGRAAATITTLAGQLGPGGLLLAGYGLIAVVARRRVALALTAGPALIALGFAAAYDSYDAHVYLLPTIYVLALWVGLGAGRLLAPPEPGPRAPYEALRGRAAGYALCAALIALALLWATPLTARQVDASADRRAIQFARTTLDAAPPAAIILTSADQDTFPLWYEHFALGRRPDLTVVAAPLLGFAWYRESLRTTYPHLALPTTPPAAGWEAALEATGRVCRTVLASEPQLVCP
jgi:hypothetical protein